VLGFVGQLSEEAVVREVGAFAVGSPAAPDSVPTFVCRFVFRIQDDSAIRRARVIQDKISLGGGEIRKDSGISCVEGESENNWSVLHPRAGPWLEGVGTLGRRWTRREDRRPNLPRL
jgi:hypothetical protein